ncbi:MAG: arsenite methyltransferase [Chloroflexi bacterium]|nr:arsenite methyltransferase [Chloroflexota bacterium]
MSKLSTQKVRHAVREHYATAARRVVAEGGSSCCGGDRCCSAAKSFYDLDELAALPDTAANASFGCGNPTLLARLLPGEVVLDLGSGAGLDVLLSAKRVAPNGKAFGLDMTDEMLALARSNATRAGITNVEFLKGHIEAIPLPDASVDVIISNCVINLSADKSAVLAEAFRVLRPGGRLAVTDIIVQGAPLTAEARSALSLWAECVTGALTAAEYTALLSSAGFGAVSLETIKVYGADDLPRGEGATPTMDLVGPETQITSAFVRALKPAN